MAMSAVPLPLFAAAVLAADVPAPRLEPLWIAPDTVRKDTQRLVWLEDLRRHPLTRAVGRRKPDHRAAIHLRACSDTHHTWRT